MGGNSERNKLESNLVFSREQYYIAMAEYCWLRKGIENPTENQIKEKISLLSVLSPIKKIRFVKPIGFKANKFFLDNSWSKVIAFEDQYYQHMAKYFLFTEGIKFPTEVEIKEIVKSLSHIELRKTIFLNKPLTESEINCIKQASYGRGVKETARALKKSEISIKKSRSEASKKLRCENIHETISIATQLGYLTKKNNQLSLHYIKTEEGEATSALLKTIFP